VSKTALTYNNNRISLSSDHYLMVTLQSYLSELTVRRPSVNNFVRGPRCCCSDGTQ